MTHKQGYLVHLLGGSIFRPGIREEILVQEWSEVSFKYSQVGTLDAGIL